MKKNLIIQCIIMFVSKITRIGLCGFENPMRDQKTEESKRHIGQVRAK